MRPFQFINGYCSAAKQKITATLQSYWQKDSVQAVYQGFTAPIYSRSSFKNLVTSSDDLKTSLSRAFKENATYALHALLLYFVYYRMVHPTLQNQQDYLGYDSWASSSAQSVIQGVDLTLYTTMICYLVTYGWQNSAQNLLLTSTITTTAGNAMKPSPDFKPCDQKECGAVTMARAGLDSGFFYLANRYLVNKVSWNITHSIPGFYGKALAFAVEAVSIGLPLVEYKFLGQCTLHKYKEMLGNYKTYCIMYGASFVAATWGSYKLLSCLSGEENPYIYDAVFSLMFQMYALLAIARETKFPGNDHVNFDVTKWLKWVAEKPLTQFVFEKLLGDLYSVERFVQSPGVGIALSVYDNEIKQGISSVRGGIQQLRDIQNSRLFNTARWVNGWLPYQLIPDEVTTACKSFSKTAVSRLIRRVEYVLEIGRTAEVKRSAQVQQPIVIGDHFVPSDMKSEQKVRQIEEIKSMVQVSEPHLSRSRIAEEIKTVVQVEIKPEQKFEPICQTEVVDSCYFGEQKNIELKRTLSPVYVAPQGSTLFAKREPLKQDSLACLTASIISNVGRTKVSR